MNHVYLLLAICLSLFGSRAHGKQPLAAPDSLPFYELSNMRLEEGFMGRAVVTCDYKRTRESKEPCSIRFVARTEDGELTIMGSGHLFDKESGEVALSKIGGSSGLFGKRSTYNYEIYLVTNANWAGKSIGPIMLSNPVSLGNPGAATTPRPLNAEEKEALEKHLLDAKPPSSDPPEEYKEATLSMKMLPGMYVVAGRYGEWEEAEFLGYNSQRKAKLRFKGDTKLISRPVENWIAVKPEDLARAKTDPTSFEPSGNTLVDGTLLLPDNAVALDANMKLVPGTPLLFAFGDDWNDVILTKTTGTSLSTRGVKFPHMPRTSKMTELAIAKSTVEKLNQPDIAAEFAANLTSGDDEGFGGGPTHRHRHIHDYEIKSRIPKTCVVVPDDIEIPAGTTVAGCFHFDWSPATVTANNDDGTLDIDWTKQADAWNGPVRRNQLIIQKKDLLRIKRNATKKSKDLAKTERVWTDLSGDHKIKATFVSKTEDEVTLRMEAGYEKTLPIAKLCEEDQELLSKVKATVENPFAP